MNWRKKISAILSEDLVTGSGMIFGAGIAGGIALFISNAILSKYFGPEVFGNYKTVVSLFIFFALVAEFGVGTTLAKYVAEFSDGRINPLVRWLFKFRILVYFIFFFLVFTMRENITFFFLKDPSLVYLIVPGCILFAFAFFIAFGFITLGFQNFRLFSISQFLVYFSAGMLSVATGLLFGVEYAIIAYGSGYLIGNLPNILFVLKKRVLVRKEIETDIWRIFTHYSLPVYISMFPYIAGQAAIPIMSLFFPQMLIGYYAFAWIFYSGIIMVSNAISSVILPKVSGLESKEATKVLKRAFGLYTPVVIFGCFACIFLSETFISIFFPAYLPGLPVFVPLVCLGLLIGYLQIYRGYFSGTGKTGKLIAVTSVQNGLLLIISFISMKVVE